MSDADKPCRTRSVKPGKSGSGLLTRPQVGQYHTGSPNLKNQVRDPKETLSAFTVLKEIFFQGA